jgi:transposase
VTVALCAARKFGVKMDSLHLDSSSFHVDGDYINKATQEEAEPGGIEITYGYSRDHRPDLKQFIIDLMCSGDGDIPLYLRVGNGNESDSAMFATIIADFKRQWLSRCFICCRCRTLHRRKFATNETFALGIESPKHPDCGKNAVR